MQGSCKWITSRIISFLKRSSLFSRLKSNHLTPRRISSLRRSCKMRTDLLILDDFGILRLEQQQRLDLMEIFEDRHGRKATIIASINGMGSKSPEYADKKRRYQL